MHPPEYTESTPSTAYMSAYSRSRLTDVKYTLPYPVFHIVSRPRIHVVVSSLPSFPFPHIPRGVHAIASFDVSTISCGHRSAHIIPEHTGPEDQSGKPKVFHASILLPGLHRKRKQSDLCCRELGLHRIWLLWRLNWGFMQGGWVYVQLYDTKIDGLKLQPGFKVQFEVSSQILARAARRSRRGSERSSGTWRDYRDIKGDKGSRDGDCRPAESGATKHLAYLLWSQPSGTREAQARW